MISANDLSKTYYPGRQPVCALRHVSLTVNEGEFVSIMGASGSGKSTLLHLLGLLSRADEGEYSLAGQNVRGMSEDELAFMRNRMIGFVFQQFFLMPGATVLENVALPLLYSGGAASPQRVRQSLAAVGLAEEYQRRPNQLSGGQQQRVVIARALVNGPRLILADEPTGNLDNANAREIMGILQDLNRRGITIVMVTHEPDIADFGRRQILMSDGRIVSDSAAGRVAPASHPAGRLPEVPNAAQPGELYGVRPAFRRWAPFARSAWHSIAGSVVRSLLSVVGIMVGTFAVIATIALVSGARQAIRWELESMGTNLLILRPGQNRTAGSTFESGSPARLEPQDARAIRERIAGVQAVTCLFDGRVAASAGARRWTTSVEGAEPAYASMQGNRPIAGRFFTEEEATRAERVALLGFTPRTELFGEANPIGRHIMINKCSFQVIGLLPQKGANPWGDQDDLIIIPYDTAMSRVFGRAFADQILIECRSESDIDQAEHRISDLMLERRHLDRQSASLFRFRNMAKVRQSFAAIEETLSWLLASIALVSLFVGGVGVMNIMLVSVTERTREIGIRKAVGARQRDILFQFLVETVVLSLLGGLAGVVLSFAVAWLATWMGWPVQIDGRAVGLALVFSGLVGVLFGIWPARQAARRDPIDALRYE